MGETKTSSTHAMSPSLVGRFVRTPHGLGKVVRPEADGFVVEFFHSLARQVQEQVPAQNVRWMRLSKQSRCFLRRKDDRGWVFGRIGEYDELRGEYEVNLPDAASVWRGEQLIFVRSGGQIDDPTDTLVALGHETAFFYRHRHELVSELTKQRRATRGFTGLASSRITLWPHQVGVVRRVLEDPVQRYLLADEVGLGKTIEAGVVLRQCLLDKPGARALVIVPRTLLEQWRTELRNRCDVFTLGGEVDLIPLEELPEFPGELHFDIVIIDEAHRAASWLAGGSTGRERFASIARIAHAADRLLLLSATPASHRAGEFLGMLHLVDPKVYRLDDLEGFKAQLAVRRQVGRLLFGLEADAMNFALRAKAREAIELFPHDEYLRSLCDEMVALLAEGVADERRTIAVATLFGHISATYRLHRRILRSRRDAAQVHQWREGGSLEVVHDESDEARQADADFEAWRDLLAEQLRDSVGGAVATPLEEDCTALCWHLAQLLDGAPSLLAVAMEVRSTGEQADGRVAGLDERLLRLLVTVPQALEEKRAVLALQESARQLAVGRHSVRRVIEVVRRHLHENGVARPPRCVVFATYTETAVLIADVLTKQFGIGRVVRHLITTEPADRDDALRAFRASWDSFILVCDRSAEEGLNLEFVDLVVHYDLPWDPNQIEQRIGRLDRISRKRGFATVIVRRVTDPGSLQTAWYDVLDKGFGVFRHSIASLQYFVEDHMGAVRRDALGHGAPLLRKGLPALRDDVHTERERLEQEAIIDAFDLRDEETVDLQGGLDRADLKWQGLQSAVEGWLCTALKCSRETRLPIPRTVRYGAGKDALLPATALQSWFGRALARTISYDREVAADHDNVALCRLGDPLLSGLAHQVNSDDRGRAFAIWRHITKPNHAQGMEWSGFRFDVIVQVDLAAAFAALVDGGTATSRHAVQRRADSLLPPRMMALTVGIDGVVVSDPILLADLERPFSKTPYPGGEDYNLTKGRLSIIEDLVPPAHWESACRQARDVALSAVQARLDHSGSLKQAESLARNRLRLSLQELAVRRVAALDGAARNAITEELTVEQSIGEALITGIMRPRMWIDAIGFIVLSDRAPDVTSNGSPDPGSYAGA